MDLHLPLPAEFQSTEDAGEVPLGPPLAVLLRVHPPLLLGGAPLATVQAVPHRLVDDIVELGVD